MTLVPTDDESRSDRIATRRSDTMLAVVAAVATLAFAWTGFQSAQWVRERFSRSDEAAALSEQALELAAEADRIQERDEILYLEWRLALAAQDDETAEVIFGLFRPPVQAYLDDAPVDEAGLPVAPDFDDPNYVVMVERNEAKQLDEESQEQRALSRAASARAARFGGLGVVFAAVLAAAGIAGRFDDLRMRRILTVSAMVMLAIGIVLLIGSPMNFG